MYSDINEIKLSFKLAIKTHWTCDYERKLLNSLRAAGPQSIQANAKVMYEHKRE